MVKRLFLFVLLMILLAGCNGKYPSKDPYTSTPTSISSFSQSNQTKRPSPIFPFKIEECNPTFRKAELRKLMRREYLWNREIMSKLDDDDLERNSKTPRAYFNKLLFQEDQYSCSGCGTSKKSPPIGSDSLKDDLGQKKMEHVRHIDLGSGLNYVHFPEFDKEHFDELVELFKFLKKTNTQRMVLDLRNNLGGDIDMIAPIAALIVGDKIVGYPFLILRDNLGKDIILNAGDGKKYKVSPEAQLNIEQIYILTNRYTASSSEALINGLRAHRDKINVIQIGEPSRGKFVASSEYKNNCGDQFYLVNQHMYNANYEGGHGYRLTLDSEASDQFLSKVIALFRDKLLQLSVEDANQDRHALWPIMLMMNERYPSIQSFIRTLISNKGQGGAALVHRLWEDIRARIYGTDS